MNLRFKKKNKINAHYSVNDFWIESVTLSLSSIHQVYVASLRNVVLGRFKRTKERDSGIKVVKE